MEANRRNLLAAVAVLPLAVCPAPALAGVERRIVPAVMTGDPAWDRLYSAFRAAEAEEAKRLAIFAPLDDGWAAIREPQPTAPRLGSIDKSLPLSDLIAQTDAPAWKATWAAYEAERAAWKARDDAAYAAHIGDTSDRYEAASDACGEAVDALMSHPVTTLEALAQKAEVMTTRYGDIVDGADAKALIADIRRLAGQEARA